MQRDADESSRWSRQDFTRATFRGGPLLLLTEHPELLTVPIHQSGSASCSGNPPRHRPTPGIRPRPSSRRKSPHPHPVCSRDRGASPAALTHQPRKPALDSGSAGCRPNQHLPTRGPRGFCGPGLGDSGVWTMAQPSSHAGSMQAWPTKRSCVVFSGEDKHCPLTPPRHVGCPCGAACPWSCAC